MDTLIKAGLVYPVSSPPVPQGAIAVEKGKIKAVGKWEDFASNEFSEVVDLSGHIVMPGFVNAHSHLQFAAALGKNQPGSGFVDWVRQVIAFNAAVAPEERERGMHRGIAEMLATGTTAVGDIAGSAAFAKPLCQSPLRSVVFAESIAPGEADAELGAAKVAHEVEELGAMGVAPGISPHAPHTVSGLLFKKLRDIASQRTLKMTSHVAESADEDEFLGKGTGGFATLFKERGIALPALHGLSPVRLLDSLGVLDGLLAVHLNTVDSTDLELLALRKTVPVFCPGSSRWFGRRAVMPFDRMIAMGLRPAMGTDSLASNTALSMLEEMRAASEYFPSLDRSAIVESATLHGANALGLECGSLTPGKWADLIAFKWDGPRDPLDGIFRATRPDFVMIGGTVATPKD